MGAMGAMRLHLPIGLSVALCALCLTGCGGTAQGTGTISVPSATRSPTSAPLTPSATIPHGQPVTGATLGGPVDAFYAKYGFEAGNLFVVDGVTFSLNDDTGSDGEPHVFEMLVYQQNGAAWTMEQAQAVCPPFLPPDAAFARSAMDSEGYPEEVYTSPEATASFAPSSPWYTADGSVSIVYDPPAAGSGVFECSLALGTL